MYFFLYILKYDVIENKNTLKSSRVGRPWSGRIFSWTAARPDSPLHEGGVEEGKKPRENKGNDQSTFTV